MRVGDGLVKIAVGARRLNDERQGRPGVDGRVESGVDGRVESGVVGCVEYAAGARRLSDGAVTGLRNSGEDLLDRRECRKA